MAKTPLWHRVVRLPVFQACLFVGGFSAATVAEGETLDDYSLVVAQSEPIIIVSYPDAVERYQISFTARLMVRREQQGETARPLAGAFIDTRECRWRVDGVVERELFLCTRLGCDSAQVKPSERLPAPGSSISLHEQRDPPSLAARIARLRPDPCPESEGAFHAAVERIRGELVPLYEREMAAGREAVAKMLRTLPGVEAVTEERRPE